MWNAEQGNILRVSIWEMRQHLQSGIADVIKINSSKEFALEPM